MIPDPRLQSELDPGESVLWQGMPDPARLAQRNILGSIFGGCFTIFSLVWMGGAFFIGGLISGVTHWGAVSLFPLFGLPFLAVGLWLLFSPATAAAQGARTIYAVTDRRLIVFDTGGSLKSYGPADIGQLERSGDVGRGDLIFARHHWTDGEGQSHTNKIGFFGIDNPREVERIIRTQFKN